MIARLQQFVTLGGLLLAGLWMIVCYRQSHAIWGVLGAAALVTAYSAVLAFEFILLSLHHADRPTRPASPNQLLRAWWGEVRASPRVFCWRQPFRSARWPDHLPRDSAGRRGLVLVHGFMCNRGIWNRWLRKLTELGTPFVAVNLEPVLGDIDAYVNVIESAVRRVEAVTGLPPVFVCHSMGGLALRKWSVELGAASGAGTDASALRMHHSVTIATPHHGTWLARLGIGRNVRQMRRQSPWLKTLAVADAAGGFASRCTCYYGHCDNIVFPPETAMLPDADNRHLPGVAHVQMVDHPAPWAHVQELLSQPV